MAVNHIIENGDYINMIDTIIESKDNRIPTPKEFSKIKAAGN